ncbi:MAG: glycosyltransferase [Lachnospira sp.]|nr:glycosyltransferase [Lachnospira sp.]
MPKVTIVLPTYNGEKYIRESIDSIINQTYKDWELIIVNDCSTDSTIEIVNSYVEADKRIKVISNEINQKLPQSLNIGFRVANSDYLTWTSDDNYYLPNAIYKMVNYMDNNHDCHMVVADMENIDDIGNVIGNFSPYDDELMLYNDCVGACFMYRRSAKESIGEYNPNWFLVEDYEYWLRFLFKYGHIDRISEVLYRYRYHENSLTGSRMSEIRKQLHRLRKLNLDYICEGLKNNHKLITCVFYEMKKMGLSEDEEKKFYSVYPNLERIKELDDEAEVAVYGAGNYGDIAYDFLNERIKYYIDGNINKIGQRKHGKKIISIEQFLALDNCPKMVIAISDSRISEVIDEISQKEIKEYSLIQMVDGWNA